MADTTRHHRESWLKSVLPRGIYGRAALILFLPVVTVTLVVGVMFLQRHFERVTQQMTAVAAQELAFLAARIEAAPDVATAARGGAALAKPLGMTLTLPAAGPVRDARAAVDLTGRRVIAELHARLPQVRAVDLTAPDKRVQVAMTGRHGDYLVTFDRARVSAANPHQLLVLMVVTSLLMTGIATIFLRNQLRPIRRLAVAAEDYGRGRVTPYRPAGAAEVRSAGTAFLDMRNRLERAGEQRRLMLSGISHDLRTPLTRLRLSVSMLSPDMAPDAAEIAAMEGDIDQMSRMVAAFLDFARDDALDRPAEPMAALAFVGAVVADAARASHPVTFAAQGDEALVPLRPDSLRRAIENLIGNATRHGSRTTVTATLSPRSLVIAVEDDGPGIPEDRHDEALRPFSRLDPARGQNPGQGGAGLGLAIAADVARAHGGRLRLSRSAALGGLCAELVLPR